MPDCICSAWEGVLIVMIRQANLSDLEKIASVHIECFPNSFSSSLGKRLLRKFYYEYIIDVPELFLVCENENHEIVGFCMGYYMENNNYTSKFFKHNWLSIILRFLFNLLIFDKRSWNKLLKSNKKNWITLNHDFDDVPTNQRGDLLSICVLSRYRGKGYANAMIKKYESILKSEERTVCMLSVKAHNERAIHFYEKNGYIAYCEAKGIERTYIKNIGEF